MVEGTGKFGSIRSVIWLGSPAMQDPTSVARWLGSYADMEYI